MASRSSPVSSPTAASISAWARDPAMSSRHLRRSQGRLSPPARPAPARGHGGLPSDGPERSAGGRPRGRAPACDARRKSAAQTVPARRRAAGSEVWIRRAKEKGTPAIHRVKRSRIRSVAGTSRGVAATPFWTEAG